MNYRIDTITHTENKQDDGLAWQTGAAAEGAGFFDNVDWKKVGKTLGLAFSLATAQACQLFSLIYLYSNTAELIFMSVPVFVIALDFIAERAISRNNVYTYYLYNLSSVLPLTSSSA